jgi:hypothetical protein
LSVLNEARENSEDILDALYLQVSDQFKTKPRTYRKLARKAFLSVSKTRRPSRKLRRKGIRQQLNYLGRNLRHIDALISAGAQVAQLSRRQYRMLMIITEVMRQQRAMYETQTQRIDDRIVSIVLRCINRGQVALKDFDGWKSTLESLPFLVRETLQADFEKKLSAEIKGVPFRDAIARQVQQMARFILGEVEAFDGIEWK